jgi:tRNA (guanine10-N2)-methyltransferase
VTEEYQDVDIPVCEGMEIIGNSEQNFGKWGRRVCVLYSIASIPFSLYFEQLITMRKSSTEEYPMPSFDPDKRLEELGDPNYPTSAGHKHFREKYFARFPSLKNKVKEDSNYIQEHIQ